MEMLVYVLLIAFGAIGLYFFIRTVRNSQWRSQNPNLPIPEIPVELPPKEDPPKVYLDPLVMQMHGEEHETVLIVSPRGIEIEILVNSLAAEIYRREGWLPFKEQVRQWQNSPAYCYCGPRFRAPDTELDEMAIAYLYGEIVEDAQFDQAFDDLDAYWLANAEKFGYEKPKRGPAFDFTSPGC